VVALLAAACSSSSSSPASTPTSAAAAGASATSAASTGSAATGAAPVKVGFICSCTAAQGATIALSKQAYVAWVDAQNAAGGILGHPIQLFTADDAGNPATAVTEVKQFVQQDHVQVIAAEVEDQSSWASYVAAQKIPVVGTDGAGLAYYSNPDFYFPGQTYDSLAAAVVAGAKKAGGTKLGVYYCAESPTCQELVAPVKAAASKAGLQVVYTGSISATAPNYTAQCLAAKQAGADVLWIGDASSIVSHVAQNCSTQGYNPIEVSVAGATGSNFNSLPGFSKFIGVQSVIPFTVKNTAGTQAMIAAFDKYAPGLTGNAGYGGAATQPWVSGLALVQSLKNGGLTATADPTAAMITNGLNMFKGETLGGMSPPITWTAGTPHAVDCWFYVGASNGTWTLPDGTSSTCATAAG
jgi:branched-chain amino acid transport system substrate-binding protein